VCRSYAGRWVHQRRGDETEAENFRSTPGVAVRLASCCLSSRIAVAAVAPSAAVQKRCVVR